MTRMKLNEFYYKKFPIESIYQKKECGILVLYFRIPVNIKSTTILTIIPET